MSDRVTVSAFLSLCAAGDPEADALVANWLDPKGHWHIYRCAGSPIDGEWMHYSGTTRFNHGPPPYATAGPADPDYGRLLWEVLSALLDTAPGRFTLQKQHRANRWREDGEPHWWLVFYIAGGVVKVGPRAAHPLLALAAALGLALNQLTED